MKPLIAYAQLVRLPNTFTAWADILLGALAAGFFSARARWVFELWSGATKDADYRAEVYRWGAFVSLLVASTLLYWSGMIWNDYFDLDQDRKERPGRPLASGRVTMRTALLLGISFMIGGVLLAGLADFLSEAQRLRSLPIAGVLVLCIFLYDGVFKKSWAGPIFMGSCRMLNILLGLSILGIWPPFWGWLVAIIVGMYIAGVTWFARTEAQVSSQRALGAAGVVILASLVLALTVPALVMEVQGDPRFRDYVPQPSLLYPYLLAAFGSVLGLAVLRAIKRPDPVRVQSAVKIAVLGLIVFDAILASAFVGSLGLLLVLLLVPGIILGRWLYST